MAFIPIPNTVEVFTEIQGPNGVLTGNVFYILDDEAGILSPRVQEVVTLVDGWMTATAMPAKSNQVSLVRTSGRDMSIQNGEIFDILHTPGVAGGNASPVLPMHTTIAISLRTGLAGRSFRGRHYWIGLAEGMVTGDFVAGPTVGSFVTILNTLRATVLPAANFTWVVASRFTNGAPRVTGVTTAINSIFAVDTRVDTQRRRLIGEGS